MFSWSEFKRGEYLRPVAACNFPLLFQRGVLICARAVSGLERPQSNDDPEIGYFNTSVRGDVSFPAAGIAPYLPTRSNLGQSSSNRAYGSFRCREMKGIPSLNSRINLLHSLGHIRFEKGYSARPREALSVRREPLVQVVLDSTRFLSICRTARSCAVISRFWRVSSRSSPISLSLSEDAAGTLDSVFADRTDSNSRSFMYAVSTILTS